MTAKPTPSKSVDITTAPIRLFKNKLRGAVFCFISRNVNDRRIGNFSDFFFSEVLASVMILGRNSLKFV